MGSMNEIRKGSGHATKQTLKPEPELQTCGSQIGQRFPRVRKAAQTVKAEICHPAVHANLHCTSEGCTVLKNFSRTIP